MRRLTATIIGMLLLSGWIMPAAVEEAVVHGVFFYSPSCTFCHTVMTDDLPPLQEKYGDQLRILTLDIDTRQGGQLYQAAIDKYNIPSQRQGVPTMIVGNVVMVGASEIPEQLPLLVENGVASGGIPWPDIPGLAAFAQSNQAAASSAQSGLAARIMRDPLGNGISILVLAGMVTVFVLVMLRAPWKARPRKGITARPAWRKWAIPALAILGLGVAGYLSYVEVGSVEAFCGPVGDCNSVQSSEYALLFGVLPLGVLGLMGNLTILAAWGVKEYGADRPSQTASNALLFLTTFGILFSIYLTFLEPFVIGATCSWCLASALLMTALFWVSFKTSRDLLKTKPSRRVHGRHGGKK